MIRDPKRHTARRVKLAKRRGPNRKRPADRKRNLLALFRSYIKSMMRCRRALWDSKVAPPEPVEPVIAAVEP